MEFEEEIFALHAGFCSLFSSVIRMKIFWVLREGQAKVGTIAEQIGVPTQTISQHLRIMRDKGAVSVMKKGREVYYAVANQNFIKGAKLIREGVLEEYKKKSAIIESLEQ